MQVLRVSPVAWLPLKQPFQSSQQVQGRPGAVEQWQTGEAKLKQQRYHRRLLGGESPIHQPNTKPQLKSKPKNHCLSGQRGGQALAQGQARVGQESGAWSSGGAVPPHIPLPSLSLPPHQDHPHSHGGGVGVVVGSRTLGPGAAG